ncbi:MAG: T9SS type A sorting domain-containing protein [Aureispira sp.]|nr:T9SS type A sorting domain-containing protein [Aureispira sp.]
MKQHPLRSFIFFGLLFFISFIYSHQAQATHALGGDLVYQCVGPSQYKVTLSLYRDCNGINYPGSRTITWTGACGTGTVVATVVPGSRVDITPLCPGQASACNGGSGAMGVEQQLYQAYITLPAGCSDVTFSWSLCCRNNAITTIAGSPLMYTETTVDTDVSPCNNSPVFLNPPSAYTCVNDPVHYNHGTIDPDGDSLAYFLVDCQSGSNAPLPYNAGYSGSQPLGPNVPVNIDVNTGAITFTPTSLEVAVMCVMVREYRNGQLVGSTVRDIQFRILPCNNAAPTLSGINGTNNYQAVVQAGNQLCFNIIGNDADSNNVQVTWDQSLAGATLTPTGYHQVPASHMFCWTPTASNVGTHTFTVTIQDDACPLVGSNTYTYTIVVLPPNPVNCDSLHLAINSTNDVLCNNNDGSAVMVATGGTAPYTYQAVNWTTGEFFTNQTGIFTNLTPGSYGAWVTDMNGCTPSCTGSTFDIGGNVNPLVATVNAQNPRCPSNAAYGGSGTTNNDGSIDIVATGGTAPYLYSIDGGMTLQTTASYANIAAGTYQVLVIDANGCSHIESVQIVEPTPIQIDVISLTNATCGQANGSITLLASGGNGINFYYLNGQSQGTNSTFTGLAAGTYTFSVCDANYCIYDTTITIGGGPAFQVATTSTNPSCNSDCDGTATVAVAGTSNYSVIWSNGATGDIVDGLCAGTYTVSVTDANGCTVIDTVVITEPAPIDVTLASSSNETSAGNDGNAVIAALGGTAPYTFQLANFTTSNAQNSSTGNFTGLNAGLHVVHVVDANGCTQSCATQFTLEGCGMVSPAIPTPMPVRATYLRINPNPAATIAQARFDAGSITANITIVNAKGQHLYEKDQLEGKGSLEMDISSWATGTYFVILKDKEGKVVKTERMIVRR